jgi:prepilin-type N-terminal cleavage/methylation domain-containing protein
MAGSTPERRSRTKGFTLIELMIALALMAIIVVWGVPSLREGAFRADLRDSANEFYARLIWARTQSIEKHVGHAVIFGQPVNGVTYAYVIIRDDDRDACYDAGEEVYLAPAKTNISVSANFANNGDGRSAMRWTIDGFPRVSSGACDTPIGGAFGAGTATFTHTVLDDNATPEWADTRYVIVSSLGNVSIEYP